ncbi:MAG: hydroxyacylglutathione hydrolase [Acetobacteraceae bacterium]|jgi:hydroxyacylglutathione hydrolase|nr:hydroxyacylglutathione hydrolase [Rhodopila sp.]MEA2728662.1 hydroxyacylglutathione hydrolase [Acetobacteraceae bacterium]MEA2767362.1 hydroxyacylglutathione hydrolase [Acetobacteraceae bacterium]
MTVTASPVPILKDNYAWLLRDSGTGATAIVDPADAEPVIEAIEKAGGRLDMILLTHHHADHTAGVDEVRARFNCPVVGAAADQYRLPKLDEAVKEGDTVRLGDATAQVIDTPGHTRGQINFFFADGDILLSGDTLFSLGCGRLIEGTPQEMFASLRKLAALPADTLVCCGHEYTESNARFALAVDPDNTALHDFVGRVEQLRAAGQPSVPSVLADEMQANPFLRAADATSFATLRAKKDKF